MLCTVDLCREDPWLGQAIRSPYHMVLSISELVSHIGVITIAKASFRLSLMLINLIRSIILEVCSRLHIAIFLTIFPFGLIVE